MNRPTGLVTFLFTDIEGSTRLAQDHHSSLTEVLKKHNNILNSVIEAHNGFVFKTVGDSFCCAFQNATDALKASAAAQKMLSEEDWEDVPVKVRMGIHSGWAEWIVSDYSGYITLARASRMMSASNGLQIIVSESTHELVDENSVGEISFRDLGERRLKDVIQPIRIYQLMSPGLREDFPPLKTLDARPNNLPIQLTSFIGREDSMKEIRELLKQSRLVTIMGSGGSGKTRLALQVAADMIDEFENGVFIIEFAHISESALVLQTVMNSLGIKEEAGKSQKQAVTGYLTDKEMLIIFDNCEHLIHDCAKLAEELMSLCPKLKIISTSREALNCSGERTYRVPTLSMPDTSQYNSPESITQYESVRLFIERALSVNTNFRVNNENAPSLAEICSRLDGIPLAIELAAARTKILSVEKIHQRLDDMFNLLTGGKRTVLPRQQTLRALIDWSYELLSEKEKILWHRLTIFSGGWTLEAAENICSDEKISEHEMLDLLSHLSEKSIINFNESKQRYSILETMKQFGIAKLFETDEKEILRSKHLDYFSSLSTNALLTSTSSPEWFSLLDQENPNFMNAIELSDDDIDIEKVVVITESLRSFWEVRGFYSTGLRLMEKLSESEDKINGLSLAKLYTNISYFCRAVGNYEKAKMYSEKCLEVHNGLDDKIERSIALQNAGNVEAVLGNFDEAEKRFAKSLEISREENFMSGIAFALNNLGNIYLIRCDYEKAEAVMKESLDYHHKSGDKRNVCFALDSMGNILRERGDLEGAKKYLTECLDISREIGDLGGMAYALYNLSSVYFSSGDFEKALDYTEQSLKLRTDIGDKPGIAYSLAGLGKLFLHQGNYEKAYSCHKESLQLRLESGDKHAIVLSLISFSTLLSSGENLILSAKLIGVIEASFEKLGLHMNADELSEHEKVISTLKEKLGEENFEKYMNEGKGISLTEAAGEIIDN